MDHGLQSHGLMRLLGQGLPLGRGQRGLGHGQRYLACGLGHRGLGLIVYILLRWLRGHGGGLGRLHWDEEDLTRPLVLVLTLVHDRRRSLAQILGPGHRRWLLVLVWIVINLSSSQ